MPVIDNAIYRDGIRVATPTSLAETFGTRQEHGGFAWLGMYRPTDAELDMLASEFNLHPLAIEDARKGHQRAKLERYSDTLFVVLRPARYGRCRTGRIRGVAHFRGAGLCHHNSTGGVTQSREDSASAGIGLETACAGPGGCSLRHSRRGR